MANLSQLSTTELETKIKAANLTIERNEGLIKEAAQKKLKALEDELASRAKEVKKDVEKTTKDVEKDVEKAAKKAKKSVSKAKRGVKKIEDYVGKEVKKSEDKVEKIFSVNPQIGKAKHSINYFDGATHPDGSPMIKIDVVKTKKLLQGAKKKYKAAGYKEVNDVFSELNVKKTTPKEEKPIKKAKKKRPNVYPSPTEKFVLTIDGQDYSFSDLNSKEACQKAVEAVLARREEQIKHKAAAAEGRQRAKTIPVTKRITEGFVSVAKKTIAEVPANKLQNNAPEVKKEVKQVEKAFDNLLNKIEALIEKKIPQKQRDEIAKILAGFEKKVEKQTDKKPATPVKKKEEGGIIEPEPIIEQTDDNSWSFAQFL